MGPALYQGAEGRAHSRLWAHPSPSVGPACCLVGEGEEQILRPLVFSS